MNQKIDLRDVKLHWGLSELTSERWRERYLSLARQLAPPLAPVIERLQQTLPGRTIESLSAAEQDEIIAAVSWFRHPLFTKYVYDAGSYAIRAIPLEDLMRTSLMSEMWSAVGLNSPVSLADYARSEPPPGEPDEPRTLARRLITSPPTSAPFGYPVIGYDFAFRRPVLIDGFARCAGLILRHDKGSTADATVSVIYCDP